MWFSHLRHREQVCKHNRAIETQPDAAIWLLWDWGVVQKRVATAWKWGLRGVQESKAFPALPFLPGWFSGSKPFPSQHSWSRKANEDLLTICCHANIYALLKATLLALIPRDFVYDTFSFIFTGVGWMEIFLNGSSKETLHKKRKTQDNSFTFSKKNWFLAFSVLIADINRFGS